jgi:NifU-like protein involved in Fe-S cluster formation/TusA-related sulfurtransferase
MTDDERERLGRGQHVAHVVWDAGGLGCGELVIELRNRLRAMPGATMRLIALDPGAPEDIPAWCRMTGHQLVAEERETCSYWIKARGDGGSAGEAAAPGTTDGLDAIYSPAVFALAQSLPPSTRLAAPDASASVHSKVCGSKIAVDMAIADGVVCNYAQRVEACLFGRASASAVAERIVGASIAEVREADRALRTMLAGGPVPTGRWSKLAALAPMRVLAARHASVLLVFTAIEAALQGMSTDL